MRWPAKWPHPAFFFVILAWGGNFPMVKLTYLGFSTPAAALIRCFWQIPVVFLIVFLLGKPLRIDKRYLWNVLIGGVLNGGLYMILFLEGMRRTSSGQGAIALATAPIFVAFVSGLLGQEKVTLQTILGSICAFTGVAVAEMGSKGVGGGDALGTLLCVASAVMWAVSVSVLRPALDNQDAMSVFAWAQIPAVLVLLPYGIVSVFSTKWAQIPTVSWIGMVYMIFIAGVGGFTAYYLGVAKAGAAKASMVSYVIPIVAAFAAWPLLGEKPQPAHLIGLALVLAGVGVVNISRKPVTVAVAEGQ